MTGNPKIQRVHSVFDANANKEHEVIAAAIWWNNKTGKNDKSYVEIHIASGLNDKMFVQMDDVPDSDQLYFNYVEIFIPEEAKADPDFVIRTYTKRNIGDIIRDVEDLLQLGEYLIDLEAGSIKDIYDSRYAHICKWDI